MLRTNPLPIPSRKRIMHVKWAALHMVQQYDMVRLNLSLELVHGHLGSLDSSNLHLGGCSIEPLAFPHAILKSRMERLLVASFGTSQCRP